MGKTPAFIEDYWWTKRDCDIRDGRDARFKNPTPYDVPSKNIPDCSARVPGSRVRLPLAGSWSQWYLRELSPDGYTWVDVPEYVRSSATIGDLCAALHREEPGVYPAVYYDLANKKNLRASGTPFERMLFDYWGNSEYRYATTLLGDFSWDAISPALRIKAGDVALKKVLAKEPIKREVPIAVAPQPAPPPLIVRAPPPLEPRTLEVGYNYPWPFNKYGIYMSPGNEKWIEYWIDFFRLNLQELAALGVKYVRIFLLGSGQRVGRIERGPEDGPYDATITLPDRSPENDEMKPILDSLIAMLKTVEYSRTGIKLIPSFVDYGIFGEQAGNSGCRRRLALDPAWRKLFLDSVLDPLLDASASYKEHIYLWEVMNEPYWICHSISGWIHGSRRLPWLPRTPPLSITETNTFLTDACSHISNKGFLATVGHRFSDDLSSMVTGDVRQFHYYAESFQPFGGDPDKIPTYAESQEAFIGEIDAARAHGECWPELGGKDKDPDKCLFLRLELLEQKKYKLALIWPELGWSDPSAGADMSLTEEEWLRRLADPLNIGDKTREALKEFTKGKPKVK